MNSTTSTRGKAVKKKGSGFWFPVSEVLDKANLAEEDREQSKTIQRIDPVPGAGRSRQGQSFPGCSCDLTVEYAVVPAKSQPTKELRHNSLAIEHHMSSRTVFHKTFQYSL
ncbi:hypothetical protein Bca4012_032222 [Brassica carinata]